MSPLHWAVCHFTKQEQMVLTLVLLLLLTGLAVKTYRTAHPQPVRQTERLP